jgi:hypothetical protein
MPISSISSWNDFFTKTTKLDYSNLVLPLLRKSVDPSNPFRDSILEISKNEGITFLSLYVSEEHLQLFHHSTVLGRSWIDKTSKLVSVLGFHSDALLIQIFEKSIKEIKGKAPSIKQFEKSIDDTSSLANLKKLKADFHYMNIVPIPHLLTTTFLNLKSHDSLSVAAAFFHMMNDYDNSLDPEVHHQDLDEATTIQYTSV